MRHHVSRGVVLSLLVLGGCSSPDAPVAPTPPATTWMDRPTAGPNPALELDRARHERLALRMARALRDPDFRTAVFRSVASSPFTERKVHLQGLLDGNGGAERRRVARITNEPEESVKADLDQDGPIELYLPVAEHRLRWKGGTDLLVATAERDGESPVGFDLMGNRVTLNERTPPRTPVLMVNRAEVNFAAGPRASPCLFNCGGGPGGGGAPAGQGLFLTQSSLVDTFESWFKGNPELEVHVLGQVGTSSSMTTLQCAGESAGGPYSFNQDDKTWSGNVLLFSQTQLDQYSQQHPGQNLRVFVVEDDDTPCQIKIDSTRVSNLLGQLQLVYGNLTGGKDSTSLGIKIFKKATMILRLFSSVASFFKTNDDPVGNAVEDAVVAGAFFPGANWVVKGENAATNGALKLEMR